MKLLRAHELVELGKIASGSAVQGLWMINRKVGFQVVGEDQSRLPGRGAVRKVGRGGRRISDRTKKRVQGLRKGCIGGGSRGSLSTFFLKIS